MSRPYQTTIQTVRQQLTASFDALDARFDLPEAVRGYRPAAAAWRIDDILEHVSLTSHYLLIIIRKGVAKACKRAATQALPDGESDLQAIEVIGHPDTFAWLRPDHMEPTRAVTSAAVRVTLRQQRAECLALLEQMGQGEGSLYTVRMSVQALGKLDMYQWLAFLALHARRHDVEIGRIVAAQQADKPA